MIAGVRRQGGDLLIRAGEKYKLAVADTNSVSVLDGLAAHPRSVDESPIVTVEIGDLKDIGRGLAYRAMLS